MTSRKDNTNSSQWALLPHDLLHEITRRLDKPSDYVRFGASCKEWLSFAHKSLRQKHLLHVYRNNPLLLIPTESPQQRRSLYNITKDMVYDQFQLDLPCKRCCGSSHGWLFFVEKVIESTLELVLINPFLGDSAKIKLPPIKFFSEDEVFIMDRCGVKAILSKDPYVSSDDYEVVALYGFAALAHYKSGDKFWSYAKKIETLVLADVIFYKDLIFSVDKHGFIVNFTFEPIIGRIESTNCSPWYLEWNTIGERLPMERPFYVGKAYLVENSRGDLLLARRFHWDAYLDMGEFQAQAQARARARAREVAERWGREAARPNSTVYFQLHRLCLPTRGEQVRVKKLRITTLHGETLFLGDNNSISVLASKYPGLHQNSIYYTDECDGIYARNLQNLSIFHILSASFREYQFVPRFSTKGMLPPIFVVPQ